ncbi:MAG: hypothetical protein K2Y56_02890 [Methylobacterium sp.]|uniref:hypothetical protein n=1 Tax=Methylobacterium sp. TaxID=409 RepID=UPI0025E5A761|nr:hypothetical protein [Methylobacterium sp.]MBX9930478.1 hypothetical protein [Methylobacterium sp.]
MAADTIKMLGNYWNPSEYGTRVHKELEHLIERLNDDRLVPEYSLLKSGSEAVYGTLDRFRLDVLERAPVFTACIHEVKTGNSPLTAARSSELAFAVYKTFPGTKCIVVIEMRPYEQP